MVQTIQGNPFTQEEQLKIVAALRSSNTIDEELLIKVIRHISSSPSFAGPFIADTKTSQKVTPIIGRENQGYKVRCMQCGVMLKSDQECACGTRGE